MTHKLIAVVVGLIGGGFALFGWWMLWQSVVMLAAGMDVVLLALLLILLGSCIIVTWGVGYFCWKSWRKEVVWVR